jgi:hypothetical protein
VAASGGDSGDGSDAAAKRTTAIAPQRFGPGDGRSESPSSGPEFPLTLRRTGGIAGFDDRIVLEANGRIRVDTPSVRGRVCTLDAPQRRQLVTLLATLRLGAATDLPGRDVAPLEPEVTESDPITISVTDEQARELDLSDPSLGEISGLVANLVSDVTLSVPATTACTTPAAHEKVGMPAG